MSLSPSRSEPNALSLRAFSPEHFDVQQPLRRAAHLIQNHRFTGVWNGESIYALLAEDRRARRPSR